jgi:hypothetical protein
MTLPSIWCHDQEPLAHEFYKQQTQFLKTSRFVDLLASLDLFVPHKNLNYNRNIFQKNILLHSEKRSQEVEKYRNDNELIPVYYWSHALIARDWFRFAQHENFKKNTRKQFLIYNRAWTGTREYRLRFSDLLIEHGLVEQCLTYCNPIENGQHYRDYTFTNPVWRPKHVLENYFQTSKADSSASADFSTEDYESTNIEVVLETLFDDDRLHLTEKSLRPIACGQPFILMSTQGSLQYLRDYGFQTFGSLWDESYDQIQDPCLRMRSIIDIMCEISSWSKHQLSINAQRMKQITDHNQKHFFSKEFSDQIITELKTNLREAYCQIKTDPGFDQWITRWTKFLQFPKIQEFMTGTEQDVSHTVTNPNTKEYKRILEFIDQYPQNRSQ